MTTPFGSVHPRAKLKRAPLVRVLAQVRWASLSKAAEKARAAADAIESNLTDEFPIKDVVVEQRIEMGPGVTNQSSHIMTKFQSADRAWAATVHEDFVTLETTAYTDHSEFCDRFDRVLDVLADIDEFKVFQRLGYRYTNQVWDLADLTALPDLLEPYMRGPVGLGSEPERSVGEALFDLTESQLIARWAFLEANQVVDPTLPPAPNKSWLFDIDSINQGGGTFDAKEVSQSLRRLSEIGSDFFRASVTEAFIEHFDKDAAP